MYIEYYIHKSHTLTTPTNPPIVFAPRSFFLLLFFCYSIINVCDYVLHRFGFLIFLTTLALTSTSSASLVSFAVVTPLRETQTQFQLQIQVQTQTPIPICDCVCSPRDRMSPSNALCLPLFQATAPLLKTPLSQAQQQAYATAATTYTAVAARAAYGAAAAAAAQPALAGYATVAG